MKKNTTIDYNEYIFMKTKRKKKYIPPKMEIEEISSKLFSKSAFKNELSEFNLLAASENETSDDY